MFKPNKSTRYAIYALLELSQNPGKILSAGEIAKKYNVSEHHVAKVLQQLAREGLVRSVRGAGGGFQILRSPSSITLWDVVQIFEGRDPLRPCVFLEDQETCLKEICQIADIFREIEEQIHYTLRSITIATLLAPKKLI